MVDAGIIGKIVTVSVRIKCGKGETIFFTDEWQQKLAEILGRPIRTNVFRNDDAISIILKFKENSIASIFADEGNSNPCNDFEIVGTKSLICWSEDMHHLSRINSKEVCSILYEHPYATELGKENAV